MAKETAVIYCWVGPLDLPDGLQHQQEIPSDKVFEISQKIFESGLNVMIMRGQNGPVLCVDTQRFQQR